MLLPLRYPRAWLVLGWLLVALAIVVSLIPWNSLPSVGGNDKFQHAFGYAVLAVWFAGIYPRSRYPIIAVGLFVMGISIEWLQGAMHAGRARELNDVVANVSGILVGLTLALLGLGGWARRVEGLVFRS